MFLSMTLGFKLPPPKRQVSGWPQIRSVEGDDLEVLTLLLDGVKVYMTLNPGLLYTLGNHSISQATYTPSAAF